MTRRILLMFFAGIAIGGSAEPAREWRSARVILAEYRLDGGGEIASGGGGRQGGQQHMNIPGPTQVARGRFEFEADGVYYGAEETVAPRTRLRFQDGEKVQIAVEKKTLLLKLDDGKIRKMRLVYEQKTSGKMGPHPADRTP